MAAPGDPPGPPLPGGGVPPGFVAWPATCTAANGPAISGLNVVPAPASGRVTLVAPGWQSMERFAPPGRLAWTTALPRTVTALPPPPTGSWPLAAVIASAPAWLKAMSPRVPVHVVSGSRGGV